MARLYLDEDIPPEVGEALTQYNHDVVHAVQAGNQSIPDPAHLLIAAEAGRILVTFNRRDFRQAHQLWTALHSWGNLDKSHAGILTSMGQIPQKRVGRPGPHFCKRRARTGKPDVGVETPATAVAALWVVMMSFAPWESAWIGVPRG